MDPIETLRHFGRSGLWLLTLSAVLLGSASAAACGCGFDPQRALAVGGLTLAAQVGLHLLLDGHEARTWGRGVLALVAMGGLLLAVRSSGGLLVLGSAALLLAWAWSWWQRRGGSTAVHPVWAASLAWLVVMLADHVQRLQFFLIPAVGAVSFAMLVANVDVSARGLNAPLRQARQRLLAVLAIVTVAHGWLLVTVYLLIPPMTALWALLSWPMSLAAVGLAWAWRNRPAGARWAYWLNLGAASVHACSMAAGLWLLSPV